MNKIKQKMKFNFMIQSYVNFKQMDNKPKMSKN